MKTIATLSLFIIFVCNACSTQTSVKTFQPEALWISGSKTSKMFASKECELAVSFLGMQDSAFTFDIYISNFTESTITLSCEKCKITITNCNEASNPRLRDLNSNQIDIVAKDQKRIFLQFKAPEMSAMTCLTTDNTVLLSGIDVTINNKVVNYGTMQFESSKLRLLKQ